MMILFLFLICVFIALGVGVLASISDIRGLVIPNAYSVYVAAAFVVAWAGLYLAGRGDVFSPLYVHIISAVLMFGFTFAMFALKMIGAADSKFASVCALWLGGRDVIAFVVYMTFVGGLLGVFALYMQKKKPFKNPPAGSWMQRVQGGESKVPYGVAIAVGMILAFIRAGYFGSDLLAGLLAPVQG